MPNNRWMSYSELIFPYEEGQKDEEENDDFDASNAPFLQKMMNDKGLSEKEQKENMANPKTDEKRFQVFNIGDRGRTVEGIESFFMEYSVIEAKYDPHLIISKALSNFGLVE
jgi:hypothetical protein